LSRPCMIRAGFEGLRYCAATPSCILPSSRAIVAGDILVLILGRGATLTATGLGIGIAAALLVTRLMRSLLFGVSPFDPLTFVGVALLLTFVALAACYFPTRRAMRIDPMVALRFE
jgi:ABC-type antimicrobial peptide transport system permease subunit